MYIKKKIKKYKQSMKDCWENIKRLNAWILDIGEAKVLAKSTENIQ
jgi:hypothetical protein